MSKLAHHADWHSLLNGPNPLKFGNYSKRFFPVADELVAYLSDFAKFHALNMRYNARVASIKRPGGGLNPFRLRTAAGAEFQCTYVIWSSGVEPMPMGVQGEELAVRYEALSTNLDDFDNKTVLIIGGGNSAERRKSRMTRTYPTRKLRRTILCSGAIPKATRSSRK